MMYIAQLLVDALALTTGWAAPLAVPDSGGLLAAAQTQTLYAVFIPVIAITGIVTILAIRQTRLATRLSFSGETRKLFIGRVLGGLAFVGYPLAGILFATKEPYWQETYGHIAVGLFIGVLVLLTYLSQKVAEHIGLVIRLGFYAIMIHIFDCLIETNLHPNHVVGLYVLLLLCNIIFDDLRELAVFSVGLLGGTILVVLVVDEPQFPEQVFIISTVLSVIFAFTIMFGRLHMASRLTFSDNIVKQSNSVVLAADRQGNIVFANPGLTEILGYTACEVMGDRWWTIRGQCEQANDQERKRILEIAENPQQGRLFWESQLKSKAGEEKTLHWVYSKLPGNYVVGIGQDVTSLKEAQDDLRELALVASKTDNYVIITDTEDQIRWVNPGFTRITGFQFSEVVGRRPADVLRGPNTRSETIHRIETKVEKGEPFREEILNYRKDGSPLWLSLSVTPIFDEQGRLEKRINIGSDITQSKQAEERLRYFADRMQLFHAIDKSILNSFSALDLVYQVGNHLLDYLNGACLSAVFFEGGQEGGNVMTLSGRTREIRLEEGVELAEKFPLKVLLKQDTLTCHNQEEVHMHFGNPEMLPENDINFCYARTMMVNDDTLGVLLFGLSGDRQLDNEGIQVIDEIAGLMGTSVMQTRLRETVKRSNQELERRNTEIAAANAELRQFAHVVSHDLKAPLRAIGSLARWIEMDQAERMDEDGRGQLSLLLGRVNRMNELIEGILAYSKLGRSRESLEVINLEVLMQDLQQSFPTQGAVKIEVDNQLPTLKANATRVVQLFQNLVGNAVKYMDKPNGEVHIGCQEVDEFWEFYVKDNGPGIDEKYHEKVFQIFQTLQPRDDVESTGIGLTIVKKIVELHGGRVWLESTVGVGTTFFFTLRK